MKKTLFAAVTVSHTSHQVGTELIAAVVQMISSVDITDPPHHHWGTTDCILLTWSLHCWWFWQETTDTETVTTNMATHKYTPSSDTRAMLWSITGRQCGDHWWRPRGHEGRGAGHLVMMSSQHHNVWLSLRTGGDRAWSVRGPAETRSLSLYVVIWAHQPQPGRARPPWPGLASPGLLCLAPALETLAHCLQLSQL